LRGGTDEATKTVSKNAGEGAKVRIQHLLYTSQVRYHSVNPFGLMITTMIMVIFLMMMITVNG
jgi:hypothetical protein